jgi:hypothetical protein
VSVTVTQLSRYLQKPEVVVETAWRQAKKQAARGMQKANYLVVLRHTLQILGVTPATPIPDGVGGQFRIQLDLRGPELMTVEATSPGCIQARRPDGGVVFLPLIAMLFI